MIFTSYAVAAAAILSSAAGAAVTRGLQGKTTPKAYIVTEVEITGDREAYQRDYAAHAAATVEPFGGHYLGARRPRARHRRRAAQGAHRHQRVSELRESQRSGATRPPI